MPRTKIIVDLTKRLLILGAFLATMLPASAQTSFEALLDPSQEVPPHNTPAYGSADFTLSGTTLSINAGTGIYNDLLAGATRVSLNDAAPGMNGPTIFTFTLDTPGQTSGTYEGSGTMTAGQITDLNNGNVYINISDSVYPSGEIRGQLEAVPEPSALALLAVGSLGLSALLIFRRLKS